MKWGNDFGNIAHVGLGCNLLEHKTKLFKYNIVGQGQHCYMFTHTYTPCNP